MFITNWGVNHLAAYWTPFPILGALKREEVNVSCDCDLPSLMAVGLSP